MSKRQIALSSALLAACLAAPASAAEEAPLVRRGTAGLDRVPFQALNRSDAAIACEASIAHWYSAEIGRAAPGETVAADLWSDPASGAVYLLNAGQDRMPVQVLFCGIEGKAASTRSDILLARRAGAAEPAIDLACDGATPDGKLACRRRQDR